MPALSPLVFRSKYKLGRMVWSLLLFLPLLLTACGGGGASNKTYTTLTSIPGNIGDFARDFNPYSASAPYGTQGTIFETLLFDSITAKTIQPWLATSYTFSSDARSVTFHLRQGVLWSDGQPFSADDVVFTFNMLHQYPGADLNNLWGTLARVVAPDPHTVIFTFQKAAPALLYFLANTWIVPKHIWEGVGDPTKFTNPNPVGTGPYILKSFSPQQVDLVKNPHYWQPGKPEVQEVRFLSVTSNQTIDLQLANGTLDWAGVGEPNIQRLYLNADPAHRHVWAPFYDVTAFYPNLKRYPFNVLAVRQAISAALDRGQMSRNAEGGWEPVANPMMLPLPQDKDFLDPSLTSVTFQRDLARSAQLLQQAGFTRGPDGIYVDKRGKKLSFQIDVVTGWNDYITICQIAAQNLKEAGIEATVNIMGFSDFINAIQIGSFDVAMDATWAGPTPYYRYSQLLSSGNTAPIGQVAATNYERWSDPVTDQLLRQYASTLDPSVQRQAIVGLEQIVAQQMPVIPLLDEVSWNEYTTLRFSGWPTAQHPYANPTPWQFPDNEVVLLNLKPNPVS